MKINLIVAYSNNYVIGNNNDIPWYYKEDLIYFKKITTETIDKSKKNIVISGYNTHLSIPNNYLKDRINIVITTKKIENKDNIYYVNSFDNALELCEKLIFDDIVEKIFIIGGESIYNCFRYSEYYKFLDKVYLTRIYKDFVGNKYFYKLDDNFNLESSIISELHPELEYQVLSIK
jgi:dihydrofolate reductase